MLRVSRYTWDPDQPNGGLPPMFGETPQHEDMSLKAIGKMLWRRKLLIFLVVAVCLALAAVASKVLPKAYLAESQIMFTQETPSATGATEDPDAPPRNETIGTQVSMLLTRSMAERAASAILKAGEKSGVHLTEKDTDPDELRTRIRVDNPEKTDLITLSLEADTPEKSALMVNHFAKAFVAWKKGLAEEKARQFTNSLGERLAKAQDELRQAQSKLLEYQQSNDLQDMSEQTKALIAEYSKRLTDQGDFDRDTAAAEAQLNQISGMATKQSQGIKISHWIRDDNLILGLQKDLSDAEVERAHTAIKYREGYPGVFEPLDAKITDLKGRIRDVVDHSVGVDVPTLSSQADTVSQYRRALVDTTYVRARQNANKRVLAHLKTALDKLPEMQRNFANLTREAEAAANRVSLLQTRYASARAGIPSAQSNVSFVGVATPPKKVARPRLSVNLVLGFLVGIFLATVAVLYTEGKHPAIHDGDQLQSASRLKVIPLSGSAKAWQGRDGISEETLELCALLGGILADKTGAVVLAHELNDTGGEAPGAELARGLSQLGRRVLLMRFASPVASMYVEPSSESEVLAGAPEGEPRIVDMPCLSDARGSGLTIGGLQSLLETSRSMYDLVILSVCACEDGPDYLVVRPLSEAHLMFLQFGSASLNVFRGIQDRIEAVKGGECYVVGRAKHKAPKRGRKAPIAPASDEEFDFRSLTKEIQNEPSDS